MSETGIKAQLDTNFGSISPPYDPDTIRQSAAQSIYRGGFDMDALIEMALTADLSIPTSGAELTLWAAPGSQTRRSEYDVRSGVFSLNTGTGVITLNEDGFYRFSMHPSFAQNGTGVRACHIYTNILGSNQRELSSEAPNAGGSNFTQWTIEKVVKATSGVQCYMTMMQASGGALNAKGDGTITGNRTWLQIQKVGSF